MRLFIALDFPFSHYLFQLQTSFPAYVRRTASFHMTLLFFPNGEENEITTLFSQITYPSFILSLDQLGGFPSSSKANVLWVGVKHSTWLDGLHKHLCQRFNVYNRFHPHITLGRSHQKMVVPNLTIEKITWKVEKISLYRSVLTPTGPLYTKLAQRILSIS